MEDPFLKDPDSYRTLGGFVLKAPDPWRFGGPLEDNCLKDPDFWMTLGRPFLKDPNPWRIIL